MLNVLSIMYLSVVNAIIVLGPLLRMHERHDNGGLEFKLCLLTLKALHNSDLNSL